MLSPMIRRGGITGWVRAISSGAIALFALVATSTAVAQADSSTRTVVIYVPQPHSAPSLNQTAPADQRAQHTKTVTVRYDPLDGSISASETFWAASFWNQKWQNGLAPKLDDVALGSGCGTPGYHFNASDFKMFLSQGSSNGDAASATLAGYRGRARGTVTRNGAVWTATVQSPAFRNRN
jgi:hypothetical protein